jgi:hypothetical protein
LRFDDGQLHILPGSVADLIGTNPPYVQTFQDGLFGSVGKAGSAARTQWSAAQQSRPELRVDTTSTANQRFSL